MPKTIRTLSLFLATLMLTFVIHPGTGYAQVVTKDGSEALMLSPEAVDALEQSIFVNTMTNTAHIDQAKALQYYDFTDKELTTLQHQLDQLTEDEVTEIVNYTLANSGEEAQTRSVSLIIWVGVIVIGIVTSLALYFSSKYITHKEKMTLIDRCYDAGGTPIIDSADVGGLNGAPEKAWWKISSTYKFECAI